MVTKMRVHNALEARALIKEINLRCDGEQYHECEWYTHDGKFLFRTTFNEYRMELQL
jgi:hypothetical protein